MPSLNNTQPIITVLSKQSDYVCLAVVIPPELDYFKGHFVDAPILPGVVQLDWAVKCAQQYLGFITEVKDVEVLKFQVVTTPDSKLTLTLERNKQGKCLFSYHSEKGKHASGRIVFNNESS